MRTPTSLKDPELKLLAAPGSRISILWAVVLSKGWRFILANTPLAPTIRIGSAAGTPVVGKQVKAPKGLDSMERNPPNVQLTAEPGTVAGSDVMGPGEVSRKVVAVRGDVAMSVPTTRTPELLAPGLAVTALLFVFISPLLTSGMIVMTT